MKIDQSKITIDGIDWIRYENTNYYINIIGNAFSIKTNTILKKYIHNGYEYYCFWINGKKKNCAIHRILAELFIPNPLNKPCVLHKDDIRNNNVLNNLRWGNKSENMQDAVLNKKIINRPSPKGEKNAHAKLNNDAVVFIRTSTMTNKELANKFGVDAGHVWKVRRGDLWNHI